jgi:hypothetical protein
MFAPAVRDGVILGQICARLRVLSRILHTYFQRNGTKLSVWASAVSVRASTWLEIPPGTCGKVRWVISRRLMQVLVDGATICTLGR